MKVGDKYANRKSGSVVVITDVDDKKGMTVEYMQEGSDKSRLTSMTTFKKSFKLIEEVKSEDAPVEEPKPIETSKEEEPKAEKKEKAPKEKKERKKRDMGEADAIFGQVCEIAEREFPVIKTYEKIPRFVLIRDENNKSMFEVRVSSKGITFNFRKDQSPVEVVRIQNNYYMPEVVLASDVKAVEKIMKAYKKEVK